MLRAHGLSLLALFLAAAALVVALVRQPPLRLPAYEDIEYVAVFSDSDSTAQKRAIARCPEGARLLTGGASLEYPAKAPGVAIVRSVPYRDAEGDAWFATARELRPLEAAWQVYAIAGCVRG